MNVKKNWKKSEIKINKLTWELSEQNLKDIKEAENNINSLIKQTSTEILDFEEYGKNYATSHKLSPDAYIQMAFQLAFYKLKKYPGSTYESANTKRFYHGRTETIRSCTKDSVNFTKIFCDSNAKSNEKFKAFKKACETHVKVSNDAKNGNGIDRHLYGMHWLAKLNQQKFPNYLIPEIYTDKSYSILKTDLLSTSNSSGTSAINLFGFGPTSTYGFGLGYVVEDNAFRVNITSFQGEQKDYYYLLKESLLELKSVIDENWV